jgi:hypothetical protein
MAPVKASGCPRWFRATHESQDGCVRTELADELEEFIRAGNIWHEAELNALVQLLETESEATDDPLPRMLSRPLSSLLWRMKLGDVDKRFADDVEGIVYPRLWKVMEGVRDEMPDGEMRTRIEVLSRRLARRFADEAPG